MRLGFLVLGEVVCSPGEVGFFSLGGGCLQSCFFFIPGVVVVFSPGVVIVKLC